MHRKKAIVFIDGLAQKDLAEYGITPRQILEEIVKIYKNNGLEFNYVFTGLPVKSWSHKSGVAADFHTAKHLLQVVFREAENEFLNLGSRKYKHDVFIFLSGCLFIGYGKAKYSPYFPGNGLILLGTRKPSEKFTNSIFKLFRKPFWEHKLDCLVECLRLNFRPLVNDFNYYNLDYLERLALVGTHEQGHLYDLDHVNDINSIMYKYSNSAGRVFDSVSKFKIQSGIFS